MKTIYIDTDFKCYAINDGNMTAVETEFFDGKCDAYIEGYRLVPGGSTWVRADGVEFHGEMISPWKDIRELEQIQREYERRLLSEYGEALKELGVAV